MFSRSGHEVVATFRGDPNAYTGARGERVAAIIDRVQPVWNVEFGDQRFLEIVDDHGPVDLLCHHAAEMVDYRSWDFDPVEASRANTRGCRTLLKHLADRGCSRIVVTGSVFEPYEGVGDLEARAFNPYGLSKHISFEILRMEAQRFGFIVGKFVIPNPFGAFEEPRFTGYLMKEWAAGRAPTVSTPLYIRDNIHVSLLALAYRRHCEMMMVDSISKMEIVRADPSGYVESQGSFARRVGREIASRTGWVCGINEAIQSEFTEPFFRTNSTSLARFEERWSESRSWDSFAAYYRAALDGVPFIGGLRAEW